MREREGKVEGKRVPIHGKTKTPHGNSAGPDCVWRGSAQQAAPPLSLIKGTKEPQTDGPGDGQRSWGPSHPPSPSSSHPSIHLSFPLHIPPFLLLIPLLFHTSQGKTPVPRSCSGRGLIKTLSDAGRVSWGAIK